MLFFEVKDTGIGIDIKNQEKIFKPFEQVKLDNYTQQGTGLGLAITKELITLMGGTIYVKSKIKEGSEFYFSINFKKANIDEINIKTQIKQIIGVKNQQYDKTILVVDDIKENRDLIIQILSSYGFKTLEAISGNDALELFDKQNEKIDLIFMDILMENLDGLQTIQIIRKKDKNSNIPIIALTANVFEEDKKQAINAGADDFLPKPVEEKDILLVLEKYLKIELEYEKEQDNQINDFDTELKNLPKEFFEKLNKQALLMNNEKIIFLLKEFNLSNDLENHIKYLIKEFKYQELIDLYKTF
jgi:CheY-like chemotaxis protein